MRRPLTALVVAGVVLLGILAAADSLRGDGEVRAPVAGGTTTRPRPPTLQETLRREEVTGFVTYSDERCRLHSLALPDMADFVVRKERTFDPVRRCRFAMGAGRFLADDELIDPDGKLLARCRRRHVEVFDVLSSELRSRVPGCAPAWRPDGGLTYFHGARILLGGRIVLFSRADLRSAARGHPNVAGLGAGVPFTVRVLELAWLDQRRLAASLEVRIRSVEPQYREVLFQDRGMIGGTVSFAGPIRGLVVSPGGGFVADQQGRMIARDGGSSELPDGVPTPLAVAFSPDENWLAAATGASILLVGTPRNDEPGRVIRLPVAARDVVWEPGGPVIDTTTTAR
jgi:hypothetical protein